MKPRPARARAPPPLPQAIIIMASQKNLPTAAVIISYFDASVGNLGLITIPCIVFYIMQVRAGMRVDVCCFPWCGEGWPGAQHGGQACVCMARPGAHRHPLCIVYCIMQVRARVGGARR